MSLALHAGFGWWVLQANLLKSQAAVAPPIADQRMLVQLFTLLPPNIQGAPPRTAQAQVQSPGSRQVRQSARLPRFESATGQPTSGQPPAGARPGLGKVGTLVPAAPVKASPALNLDLSRAAMSAELQRRKSPLAAAVDAVQSENSQTPEARAFAKLAPVPSGIASETIMADGSRFIKFSGGGCMRVVNPSSRLHDDTRKPVVETC